MADAWEPVPGENGLYARDYGEIRALQLRMAINGREYIDDLGMMGLEQARLVGRMLASNRQRQAGPQSWAVMQAESLVREAERNLEAVSGPATFGEYWVRRFWPQRQQLAGQEAENRRLEGRWRNYIRSGFEDMPLARLDARALEDFRASLLEKGASEATARRCLLDLRRMWNMAMKDGLTGAAFPGREMISASKRQPVVEAWLEPEQVSGLLQAAYDRRLKSRMDHDVWCYIALSLGLGLSATDIHRMTIRDAKAILAGKDEKYGFINAGPGRKVLKERLDLYPPMSVGEALFRPLARRQCLVRQQLPRPLGQLIDSLGLKSEAGRIDFYALRRTFALYAAIGGLDLSQLRRLLGHKHDSMAARYAEIARQARLDPKTHDMAAIFSQLDKTQPN